jgi:hypothetical protein
VTKWSNLRSDGKATHDPNFPDTDYPIFRLAEAHLTYAEAILRSGGQKSDALIQINQLRNRAHAIPFNDLTLDMILDEKAREFYAEAQRRTDLIRFDYLTTSKYIWDWKGGVVEGTPVSPVYNLLPLPVSDLNANRNLQQNPGY